MVWKRGLPVEGVEEVPQLASVADQFQIKDGLSAAEEAMMGQLSLETCG